MRRARVRTDQAGLTLVEVLAALTVFSIITVGIFPLLMSSLRGATLGRSYTVGKNVAVDTMERVRGLPFSRSVSSTPTPRRLDVLDLYFPCSPSTPLVDPCGTSGTRFVYSGTYTDPLTGTVFPVGTFITTCAGPPAVRVNPACPVALPAGYTVRFDAQFVVAAGTTPETYTVLNETTSPSLPTTYNWSKVDTEIPPSKLIRIGLTVTWRVSGALKRYSLDSLIADRKFGLEKINGQARVDFAVRVLTTYADASIPANLSDLIATGASAESGITSRLAALADQDASGGGISLIQQGTTTTNAVALIDPPVTGATSAFGAPPDQVSIPSPAATAGATIASHPSLCQNPAELVAANCLRKQAGYIGATETTGLRVYASADAPDAQGTAGFNPSSTFDLFADSQRNATLKNPLRLLTDTTYSSGSVIQYPLFSVRPVTSVSNNSACLPSDSPPGTVACRSMFATTTAATGALGAADRRVETTARAGFAQLRLFPVDFIPGSLGASKAVFRINNFAAAVNCKATASTSSDIATADWSATLEYYVQNDPDDGKDQPGHYETKQLTEANVVSVINDLKLSNPMVYEVPDDAAAIPPVIGPQQGDIYLFPKTDLQGKHPSYLVDLTGGTVAFKTDDVSGRTSTAQIAGALTFTSAPTDPDVLQSTMNVVLGTLGCSAADRRT